MQTLEHNRKTSRDLQELLEISQLVDSYEAVNPDREKDPSITFPPIANTNNEGSRIDYVFVTPNIIKAGCQIEILSNNTVQSVTIKFNKLDSRKK